MEKTAVIIGATGAVGREISNEILNTLLVLSESVAKVSKYII